LRFHPLARVAFVPAVLLVASCSKGPAHVDAHDPVPVTVGEVIRKDVPVLLSEIG